MKAARGLHKPPKRAKEVTRRVEYQAAREAVYGRCGGFCEFPSCGRRISLEGMQAHHRKLRSAGGPDCPCNLMALCAFDHHGKVHAYPAHSRDAGWIVSRFEKRTPSQVGLAMREGFKFLSCDGRVVVDPTPQSCSVELHATVHEETNSAPGS